MTAGETPATAGELRDAIRLVLDNWRMELRACLAEWFPMRADSTGELTLATSTGEIIACEQRSGLEEELGHYPRDDAGMESIVQRLAQSGHLVRGKADVMLRFCEELVLRPSIRLPKASARTLRGILGFELERLSPVPPSELYFDFLVRNHDRRTNRVDLAIRALRRREVDDALRLCHAAGLSVAAITFAGDREAADWRFFPLDRGALLRRLWKKWGSAALGVLAFVLFVALLLATADRTAVTNDLLADQLAAGMAQASVVDRIEQKIADIRGMSAHVVARRSEPLLVATLSRLTDALPDGTWITALSVTGTKIRIQGFSHAASDLIGRLDQSGHFSNTQFGAPLVRNPSDGTERFDLSAEIVGVKPR